MTAFGVHSEVGRLRKVMVHRPGLEHTRLTPENAGDLLFDDVLWVKQAKHDPDPARRWLAFLRNHREAIAAMDFFTVPTLTFGVLYCFFVIGHDRRTILHCNVTRQPNAL